MRPADQELVDWLAKIDAFRCKEAATRLTSLSQANERMAEALAEAIKFAGIASDREVRLHDKMEDTDKIIERWNNALSDLSAPPGDGKEEG